MACIQTPGKFVAVIRVTDLALSLVQTHEEISSKGAVMADLRTEEECS